MWHLRFNKSAAFIELIPTKFNVLKTFCPFFFCVVLKEGRCICDVPPGCIEVQNIFCIQAVFVPNVAVENRYVNNNAIVVRGAQLLFKGS